MSSLGPLLNPAVLVAIRCEAHRAWRSLRHFGFDHGDVHQELLLHWVRRRRHHDPNLSSPATFVGHICRHRSIQMLKAATVQKRGGGAYIESLSDSHRADGAASGESVEPISHDCYEMRIGRRSRPDLELLALRIDVERTLETLPDNLVNVARLLKQDQPIAAVAASIGQSRATVYRRVSELRIAFERAGLHTYMRTQGRV
ncbi:MAG TPA: hypothetical protein VN428_04460 [Bryobacteraceae bacterium]|nr:hypothetical protein [Bryobacteraceae bacterium]